MTGDFAFLDRVDRWFSSASSKRMPNSSKQVELHLRPKNNHRDQALGQAQATVRITVG